MREYMLPKKGVTGLHMMLATCTVQVNLDYSSEERMVRLFRTALALQPLATALRLTLRSAKARKTATSIVVTSGMTLIQTEPACCRLFLKTVSDLRNTWTISSICPCTSYTATATILMPQPLRDFMKGELPALPGEKPRLKDWEDHMTTAFPEVRLKQYLEMRGADGGPWE